MDKPKMGPKPHKKDIPDKTGKKEAVKAKVRSRKQGKTSKKPQKTTLSLLGGKMGLSATQTCKVTGITKLTWAKYDSNPDALPVVVREFADAMVETIMEMEILKLKRVNSNKVEVHAKAKDGYSWTITVTDVVTEGLLDKATTLMAALVKAEVTKRL